MVVKSAVSLGNFQEDVLRSEHWLVNQWFNQLKTWSLFFKIQISPWGASFYRILDRSRNTICITRKTIPFWFLSSLTSLEVKLMSKKKPRSSSTPEGGLYHSPRLKTHCNWSSIRSSIISEASFLLLLQKSRREYEFSFHTQWHNSWKQNRATLPSKTTKLHGKACQYVFFRC